MIHTDDNDWTYYGSLEEIKEDFTPIKAWSLLQFFSLRGKTDKDVMLKVKEDIPLYMRKYDIKEITAMKYARVGNGLYTKENSTDLVKANLIPLECEYLILAKDAENTKYYLRKYKGYDIDSLFFFRDTLDFSGDSEPIETLRRYVFDDRIWLLFTPEMVDNTKKMLERVCKFHMKGDARLSYKLFLHILECELKLEDYMDYGKNHVGFRTCCKIQQDYINDLWKQTKK